MTPVTTYMISSTDGSRSVVVHPRTIDGLGGVQRSSDLTLHGSNAGGDWGKRFNENFYRLLENFASGQKDISDAGYNSSIPIPKDELDLKTAGLGINRPILGQLWFNTSTQTLHVNTNVGWMNVGDVVTSGKINPTDASITGRLFYNITERCLYVADGTEWTSSSNIRPPESTPPEPVPIPPIRPTGTLFIDPVTIYAGTEGTDGWIAVDLTDIIPSDATSVLLEARGGCTGYRCGVATVRAHRDSHILELHSVQTTAFGTSNTNTCQMHSPVSPDRSLQLNVNDHYSSGLVIRVVAYIT